MDESIEFAVHHLDGLAERLRLFVGSFGDIDPIDEETRLTQRDLELAIACVQAVQRLASPSGAGHRRAGHE